MCNPWHLSFSHYCIHIFWNKVPWWWKSVSVTQAEMLAVVLKFNSSNVQLCSQTSLLALWLYPGSYGDRRPNETHCSLVQNHIFYITKIWSLMLNIYLYYILKQNLTLWFRSLFWVLPRRVFALIVFVYFYLLLIYLKFYMIFHTCSEQQWLFCIFSFSFAKHFCSSISR